VTADPRVARLREADSNGNAYLVPEMRDAWPAMVTLVETVLRIHHQARGHAASANNCAGCVRLTVWPCGEYMAALAVLDTLDPP
jgi:hypothetical protein